MITVKSCFLGNLLRHISSIAVVILATSSMSSLGQVVSSSTSGGEVFEILRLKNQAQKGDMAAQVALGDLFGNRQQFAEAVIWYRYAATNGEVTAQLALASCLITGRGTAENRSEAAYWMRAAADGVEHPRTIPPQTAKIPRAASLILTKSNAVLPGILVERSKNLFTNAHSHSTHESRSDTLAGIEPSLQERSVAIQPSAGSK